MVNVWEECGHGDCVGGVCVAMVNVWELCSHGDCVGGV